MAVTSPVANLVECCIYGKLMFYVSSKTASWQHGFVTGRSTATNLLTITHYFYSALVHHIRVDVIYTDFSKAFDKVDFGKLMEVVISMGVPAWLCKVI